MLRVFVGFNKARPGYQPGQDTVNTLFRPNPRDSAGLLHPERAGAQLTDGQRAVKPIKLASRQGQRSELQTELSSSGRHIEQHSGTLYAIHTVSYLFSARDPSVGPM